MRFTINLNVDTTDTPRYDPPRWSIESGLIRLSDRVILFLPDNPTDAVRYLTTLAEAALTAAETLTPADTADTAPDPDHTVFGTLHNGTYE